MKYSKTLGINEQFEIDRTLKSDYKMSGIGSVMYIIRFTIYIVSTSIQNRAGLNDMNEAPLEEAPAPPAPADGPTTAAVTPAAPAALVTTVADVMTAGAVI